MKLKRDPQIIIEQFALLFASLVWTIMVLLGIGFFWAYQDVQARWEFVLNSPPEALAQAAAPTQTPSPTPTVTPWPNAGVTKTPEATLPPTPVPTLVIAPPSILPETFNADEPTPIAVIVHADGEATDLAVAPGQYAPEQSQATAPTPASVQQTASQPAQNAVPDSATMAHNGAIPTRLVIPSVGIDSKVIPVGWSVVEKDGFQYSIWRVADYAVGWHETTALLGQPGNTVMAGHHNINGEVFRDLVNVEVGDKVIVYADNNQQFEYEIELKTIVKEKGEPAEVRQRNAEWIAPTDDERLTFVTCWPYTNNTHRVIVVAKPTT